jgi:hypothetical protein
MAPKRPSRGTLTVITPVQAGCATRDSNPEPSTAAVLVPGLPAASPGRPRPGRELPPGDRGAEVRGDFHDVLVLPDGSAGLAAGDPVGHHINAAAMDSCEHRSVYQSTRSPGQP